MKSTTLAQKFEQHADEEGRILAQYRTLAEKLGTSAVGMLIDQILTEEETHHLLLHTMARWLKEDKKDDRRIPSDADRGALLRLTQTLYQHERQTIDACDRLRSELGPNRSILIDALLDGMALDSEKHARLLQAVEKILQA